MLTTLLVHTTDRSRRKILSTQIWLKLLQKHKNQCDLILLVKMLNGGIFDLLQVEVHIFVAFQNIRRLIKNVVKEFSHKQGRSLVFLARNIHFILEFYIVTL